MENHLSNLVDYDFTAQMEEYLDAISRHEVEHLTYLREFFLGNDRPGLKQIVQDKIKEIDARALSRFSLGMPATGAHTEEVFLRVGKFGPYVEQGARRANIPHDWAPDELTLETALELLDQGQRQEEPLGYCPETQRPVYLKSGRFGPYVQLGALNADEKPKNVSLPKGMPTDEIDLGMALKLLSLPRTLGQHPENREPVLAYLGSRYGPFIKCGAETRSLPDGMSPLDVTLDQALALLAQPKTRGRRASVSKEPVKVFDASPVTGQPVKLLAGRYGPYVTDGQTNATLPRGTAPDALTFEEALKLLEERAAKGPPRGRRTRKKKA
jgi:DNA topoisomerase-1